MIPREVKMKCYINQSLSHRIKRFTSYTSQFFLRSSFLMLVLVNTLSLNLFASVLNVQLGSTSSQVFSSDMCKALIKAVREGNIDTVSTLCNDLKVSKVHINSCVDEERWGVLHYACSLDRDKAKVMCELLLKQGADVNVVNNPSKHTPLHIASNENNAEVCELLLTNGANLEAQDRRGETPLHIAARYGRLESCIVLLKHGANKEARNEGGLTPLDNAVKDWHTEVSDLLSNKKKPMRWLNFRTER